MHIFANGKRHFYSFMEFYVIQLKIKEEKFDHSTTLNELIGHVASTVFLEIWPEHSLIDTEQESVGDFFYFKYFSRGSL